MTEAQLNQIRQLAKDYKYMCLYGFTSTSRHRHIAETFAHDNEQAGLKRVLIHIYWNRKTSHYFMNAGAFEYEEEILLYDGNSYQVLSVQDHKYQLYKVKEDLDFKSGTITEGTGVIVVNNQPDEDGDIFIRPLEGDCRNRQWVVPPDMIIFIEEVTNKDSSGKPITVVTLSVGKME